MGRTKQKLQARECVFGGWIMIGHPSVAEIMAAEGFDWIAVDMEHTSISVRDFHEIALALKGSDCDLFVRLPSCDPVLTKLVLDNGATGIIVPNVNTPAQAAQAVSMAKFPPDGTRGASLCRATGFGREFQGYYQRHNSEVVVVVMLEHRDGVQNADAILSTPGIDAVLVGPYDLSASLGVAGNLEHAEVLAAQRKVLDACARLGVAPGIHVVAVDPVQIEKTVAAGYRFIGCSMDTMFIRHGCAMILDRSH